MVKVQVVLADDHAVVRAGIRKALEGMNQLEIVGEADDGPSLRTALTKYQPDLLIFDITMPDFDPIPSIRHFRTVYPKMKILVISAYDDDVYVQGLLQAGVNGYHLKDQSLKDLRFALQRVLKGEKWISSPLVDKLISYRESNNITTPLTSRQRDILRLLKKGHSNQTIALDLNLSVKTIENHLTRIYRIINVQSRVEAVNYISQNPHILGIFGEKSYQPKDPETRLTKQITLLLVDDNPHYRQQLKRIIGNISQSATILEAESTENAISLTRTSTPKLILVDVLLGEENGIQCAKQLKEISPTSRIVLISAYPDEEFRRQSLDVGASAFIDKKILDSATIRQILEDISI